MFIKDKLTSVREKGTNQLTRMSKCVLATYPLVTYRHPAFIHGYNKDHILCLKQNPLYFQLPAA